MCHSNFIMHRDIKPENIMLHNSRKGEPRKIFLIDFGEAKQFLKGMTESDMFGSPHFIAPEVIAKSYTEKADLWSCGMIAHLLLTKQLPFGLSEMEDDEDVFQLLKAEPKFVVDE